MLPTFNAALPGGSFGSIWNAYSTLEAAENKSHANGVLRVTAYQIGGTPNILSTTYGFHMHDGIYSVATCPLNALSGCQNDISNVLTYAQQDFSKQISINDNTTSGNLVAVGEPGTTSYQSAFALNPPPTPNLQLLLTRIQMNKLYKQAVTNEHAVDHILAAPIANEYSSNALMALDGVQHALQFNRSLFSVNNVMGYCYMPDSSYTDCSEVLADIDQEEKSYNTNALMYFMDNGYTELEGPVMYAPINLNHGGYAAYSGQNHAWVENSHFKITLSSNGQTLTSSGSYIGPDSYGPQEKQTVKATLPYNYGVYSGIAKYMDKQHPKEPWSAPLMITQDARSIL